MALFNAITSTPSSGSSMGTWDTILGGVNDIFGSWSAHDLKKKEMSLAAQYGSGQTNLSGYSTPGDGFAGSVNYQKWGFVVGLVGVVIAIAAFVLKK